MPLASPSLRRAVRISRLRDVIFPGVCSMASAASAPGSSSVSCCRRLCGSVLRDLLQPAQGVLFDCDGVLWEGERALPGAPELVQLLHRRGKAALFVSNNSRRSLAELQQRFSRLGFGGVRSEHLFSSAFCSALFLRQRLGAQPGAKVYVIGGPGLRTELREAGLTIVGDPAAEGAGEPEPGSELEAGVRAVLVGYDEEFNFHKLSQACLYLRDPECLLVATDRDPWHLMSGGRRTPGTGSLAAAVETATSRKATVVGKPSVYMFEHVVGRFGIDPSRTLMVGDRLEMDIQFGKNCGLTTILTLTGVSQLADVQANMESDVPAKRELVPDYYVDSIADLIPGLED
ncbi:pyridoxal phosphate phosphatase [Rhinatrema bivittatum]|uniref:pyridoxal phosphate phosphatase n=1 Tax=Rhinatrema bivittatum TaxID=194408 RepID=UPI00112A6AA6|nr:pyridoxal phosphate phosphatase [Rhinatrema bivittatum]